MDKVITIKSVNVDPFMITWDLGRRCNYDCSYCPAHRHDNFSKHAPIEELMQTVDFVLEYVTTIMKYRDGKECYISFTGGEPTVHPRFIQFSQYIKTKRQTIGNAFKLSLDLTTNGAMSERIADAVIDSFDHVTVSYHAEADQSIKRNVIDRIKQFHSAGMKMKVNMMMHAQQFDECTEVCNELDALGIPYIARTIGEDPESKPTHAHVYTDKQRDWFAVKWNTPITKVTSRPCCGGRTMSLCTSSGNATTSKHVHDRNFKGWYCSVNWYFLHIEQQTGLVYHHQTCQADFGNKRGAIGSLSDWKSIVSNLIEQTSSGALPTIICPNLLCGCGLCTPKSENAVGYLDAIYNKIDTRVLTPIV